MSDNFANVGEFHEQFGLDSVTFNGVGQRPFPPELADFRIKFMQEELDEFIEGHDEGNLAKMADALIDLVYVAMGTAHLLGLPWQELWNDVQRANLAKVRASSDGSDSKRLSAFDVIKPEGWVPPHTEAILEAYGFDLGNERL